MMMAAQDESHNFTAAQKDSLANLRSPEMGTCEALGASDNPLLWYLGRYRRVWGIDVSIVVAKQIAYGLILAGIMIGNSILWPQNFSINEINIIATLAVGLHIYWMAMRMSKRVRYLIDSEMLEELLLTRMQPREIASAICQSVSRPILASLLGVFLPIYLLDWVHIMESPSHSGISVAAGWGVLLPFVVLVIFAFPWILLDLALNRRKTSFWIFGLVAGWAVLAPFASIMWSPPVSFCLIVALTVATLNTALVIGPKVPKILAGEEAEA